MEDDFDVNAAVDDIGSGLGFEVVEAPDGDVELEVEAPAAPSPAPTSEKAAPTAEAKAPSEPTTPVPTPPADEPPKTWRKEASATWASLPSEAKAEILKREADIFQGIESYKVDATFGKSVKQVVAPYEQILRQNNMDPVQTINGLMASHYALATGTPQQKAHLFQLLAKDYNIDIVALAATSNPENAPYVDPAVANLQQKLNAVESQLSQFHQARAAEVKSNIAKQVSVFADDPKNVYFDEVAEDITALLQKGVCGTLQEAYDKAIWLNPATRAKETARIAAEQAAANAVVVRSKTASAKAATAANVKASVKSGSATTPLGSLDDTLNEALASIKARGG